MRRVILLDSHDESAFPSLSREVYRVIGRVRPVLMICVMMMRSLVNSHARRLFMFVEVGFEGKSFTASLTRVGFGC
jgi:hypothetical protein